MLQRALLGDNPLRTHLLLGRRWLNLLLVATPEGTSVTWALLVKSVTGGQL
jgi:hypothetical protein